MSCFWFHKWSKWEQYTATMFLIEKPEVKTLQPMQKRKCEDCGYEQREEV